MIFSREIVHLEAKDRHEGKALCLEELEELVRRYERERLGQGPVQQGLTSPEEQKKADERNVD